MNLGFQDKVYIITGSASRIGEAVCKLIAGEGGIVVIADKNKEKSNALASEIINQKQNVLAVAVELTDEESCRQLIEDVISKYKRIDGLINNAGTNDKINLRSGSVQGFEQSLYINMIQYFILTHYALPHLIKTKGSIVNIGSKVSATGQENTLRYTAGQGGVNALTREWAVELLPHQIRVNAVLPAEVSMPQYPDAIANTVVFLLSEQSSHTTGQLIFC